METMNRFYCCGASLHYLTALPPAGLVRLEQKNETFFEMDIFDDGPFETGDESEKNPDLVPAAPNSYLGGSELQQTDRALTASNSNVASVAVAQAFHSTRARV